MYSAGPRAIYDHTAGIASKNADTDWLGTDISPTKGGMALRIAVVLATSRAIKVVDDTDTVIGLNGGTALAVNQLYVFDLPMGASRTYNLQNVGGASVIDYLLMWEIEGNEI